jgi:site-specific DNA-adenine methylase
VAAKEKGNTLYKKREFDAALVCYDEVQLNTFTHLLSRRTSSSFLFLDPPLNPASPS